MCFALIGVAGTLAYAVLYLLLRQAMPAQAANALPPLPLRRRPLKRLAPPAGCGSSMSEIASWVSETYDSQTVGGVTVYDLPAQTASATD